MSSQFLAAELDDQVVVLDAARARLMQMDPWTRRVWESCRQRATEAVAAALQVPVGQVTSTLRTLADAGLISQEQGLWRQTDLRWV